MLEISLVWMIDPKMWSFGLGAAEVKEEPVPAKSWGLYLGFVSLQVTFYRTAAATLD